MLGKHLCTVILLVVLLSVFGTPATAVEPHAGMLRYPDVSATHIAFLYANDLWLVPKAGGVATPLAGPPGQEMFPKFSPDGGTIAFVGNYDGNKDIYTIPVTGGIPLRVTHHPTAEVLDDWTSDGRLIFFAYGMQTYPRATELFTVPASGGLPEKLPVPYGANAAISPDGKWLAYTPHTADFRTWKRYRGGMATDIWLFNLKDNTSKKITDWEGTDTQPMWNGDRIYYLSDGGPEHRLNIWLYDTKTRKRRQVTAYKDFDVKWPSIGPGSTGQGEIVFQYGPDLQLLDLGGEGVRTVRVTIPGDRPKIRVQTVDAKDFIFNRNISSTGKRAVVEARGDIWTLPAKKGSPIDLNRTSGIAERDPAWSPDGQWIAYFSDSSGAYELYITQSDGAGSTRRVTTLGKGFLYDPTWSPDSKWISFWDQTNTLYLLNIESRKTRVVDRTASGVGGRGARVSWSNDSNWMAYSIVESMRMPAFVRLYDVVKDEKHTVTSGMFNDTWPTFDREGKYLYFASQRDFSSPTYDDQGSSWVYDQTDRLYTVPLRSDITSPLAPKSDDEKWGEDKGAAKTDTSKVKDKNDEKKKDEGESKDKEKKAGDAEEKKPGDAEEKKPAGAEEKKAGEPIKIDLEGFEHRTILLPVERGSFLRLSVNDAGKLIYMRVQEGDAEDSGVKASIHLLDLDEEKDKEKTVMTDVRDFAMSADGKKLLIVKSEAMGIVDARPEQRIESVISTSGMKFDADPRQEWRQIFTDTWRIQRDFFYATNMHGVDWEAVRKRYGVMLDDCASREDVSYVIGEMISELNVGHAYYWGGDNEKAPSVSVGMLGCDFELQNGAYRISRIIEGDPWDVDARGPLSQPGSGIKTGDYVLAVNGVPIDTAKDPWAAFQGLAGRTVTLTVSGEPTVGDSSRRVLIELRGSESALRYRAWVDKNRAYVADKTGGKVGYIYVPDTGIEGQNELVRQFYGQINKEALIIDERWNGGGQIPDRFIELLNRPVFNYWSSRHTDENIPWPAHAQHGPKCMLINGLAGSGGDYFPFSFRKAGLGKLIGTRTWGGLVGMSGNPRLIDGGYTSVPTFAFYKTDGTWGIEGHGVDPDIEVVDDPALMVGGKDPQLDAAIKLMMDEIARNPFKPAARPAYPDRSGMGILEKDK
ncbi:MAG: PDZ domain-containing protein [Candidatus Eisenbacteria bacterium]|nr:PDZ domain-containing protein [Candidatus Eisenbacteria bacterium]